MRICIVSVQWIPVITGGGGVSVVNLVRELAKEHDVVVYCFGLGDLVEEETMILNGSHVRVKRFFTRDSKRISNPFEGTKREEIDRLREFADRVVETLDCSHFDVIHLHGHFVVPSLAKRLKEKRCESRIVTTIHAFESIIELEKGEYSSGRDVFNEIVSMERDALEYSDVITVGSRSLLEEIRKIHGEKYLGKIRIIPMGIEDKFFEALDEKKVLEIKRQYAGDGYLILNINRLDPSKCIEYIIESMKYVVRYLNNARITLVIAGKFEDRNRQYLDMLIEIKKRVESCLLYTSPSPRDRG